LILNYYFPAEVIPTIQTDIIWR